MKLRQATEQSDWTRASKLLLAVATELEMAGWPLWNQDQISPTALANAYELNQLYWLEHDANRVGLVFLMQKDPKIWPEKNEEKTLYFHKLAISPEFKAFSYGRKALEEICRYALSLGLEWVRLDCDDRVPLHEFYQKSDFCLVDIKKVGVYMVSRYELDLRALN